MIRWSAAHAPRLSVWRLTDRYVQIATFNAVTLVGMALTGLFSLLEFVEQLAFVGQGHYRVLNALIYVLLSAPYRLLQVTPVSMLLGSMLALGTLARTTELTAILGAGLPERRIVGSVLLLIVPLTAMLFLMSEFLIPPAQQLAQAQRRTALSTTMLPNAGDSFWAQNDREYLNVQRVVKGDVPVGIDVFAFAPNGSLERLLHAEHAEILPGNVWRLRDVSRKTASVDQVRTERLGVLDWHAFITPKQLRLLGLPVSSLAPTTLYGRIRHARQQEQKASLYEEAFWEKISIPFSMAALVLLSAPLVFGAPRALGTGREIARGIAIGIGFLICQQLARHVGPLLGVSRAVSALAPALLIAAVAACLFPDVLWRDALSGWPVRVVRPGDESGVERALPEQERGENDAEP